MEYEILYWEIISKPYSVKVGNGVDKTSGVHSWLDLGDSLGVGARNSHVRLELILYILTNNLDRQV